MFGRAPDIFDEQAGAVHKIKPCRAVVGMNILLTGVALAMLAFAAFHDVAGRTVPNCAPALLLMVGASLRVIDHNLLPALAVALVAFLPLFAIWVAGLMGGGDVKLWAASVLLIPPSPRMELRFFADVVVLGGLLAVLYLLLPLVVRKPTASTAGSRLSRVLRVECWRIKRCAPLPYACAIASGAFAVLLPQILKS